MNDQSKIKGACIKFPPDAEVLKALRQEDLTLQTTASGDTSRVAYPQGATHTPGPWKSHPASAVVGALVSYGDITKGESIAAVMPQINMAECTANARLIAQSPALLAALRSLTTLIRNMADVYGAEQAKWLISKPSFAEAEAVIARAEGSDRP